MSNLNHKSPKDYILDVARNVFSHFGFSKTTMNDIAEAARKGRRTIYSYFKSKEEIYQAVIQKEIYILQNKLSSIVKENLNPRKKLEKYIKIRMNTISELSNYYDAIKNAMSQNYEMIEHIRRRFDEEEILMIGLILEEGNQHHTFNIANTNATAESMVMALKGLELPVYFGFRRFTSKKPFENLLHILFNGILMKTEPDINYTKSIC